MQRLPISPLARYRRSALQQQGQQQQTRGLVIVDVKNNSVDAALGKLQRACKDNGLMEELRKRQHYASPSARKYGEQRLAYNKRMGYVIQARLKWIARRRSGL